MSEPSQPPEQPRRRAPLRFPTELPISSRVEEIERALSEHQVIIVAGATGSGKTTQLPKVALVAGRGGQRQIGVTQPRRIAATSVAARVAEELQCQLGQEVGYQIRFEDRSSQQTWVKFMTDGILLAETQHDPLLDRYDTLIIDEAHERSLNIDFLLGWLKRILPRRPELKVIVSSATLETEKFSSFFDGAPIISVEGRTFGVDVLYEPPAAELDLSEAAAAAVSNIASLDPRGDILVFLPGEREIRETEQALATSGLRHTQVLPLYSRLAAGDQAKVFASTSQRRVILATNVAETSLTLPGIVYVVDTGVARLSRYDPRTGTTRLQLEAVSQASAEQRKGRCGRVREGICVRLFDEQSFAARPAYTDPELKRSALSGVILRMKALGLGAVEEFPFLDPPQARAISEGYRVLQELGALDDEQNLTDLGRQLARFPLDPRLSRMILAGAELGCLDDILVLAAALSIQDPRERPRGLEAKADQLHARFRDERSDFAGLLKLWAFLREQAARSNAQLRRACKETLLSFVRVREWREVYRQLQDVVRDLRLRAASPPHKNKDGGTSAAADEAVHLALLSGLLSRVGQYSAEQRAYLGSRQTRFLLHPASGLAKKPPAWVMAFELVETSQLFARTAAKIDPLWLDRVGGHLLKRSYSEPHWSEKSARASVREHATLFGLPVLRDRSVDYATIAPTRARLMFLEHALVRNEYQSRGAFQAHNLRILAQVARLRDKARQSDMLADDEALLSFFDRRVPAEVVNGKTFEAWRERAEAKDPQLLWLSLQDVVGNDQTLAPEQYPDALEVFGTELEASYRFEPGADDDGVTLRVPLVLLPQLGQGELDATIPAWRERKIAALLEELPRAARRDLGDIKQLATELARHLAGSAGPLLEQLSRGLFELKGVDIEPARFRPDAIAPYLHFYFRVVGERGQVLGEGRDLAQLCERFAPAARDALRQVAPPQHLRRSGITTWDFEDLPAQIARRVHGNELLSYPALVERDGAVALDLFESAPVAERAHGTGVRRLLQLACKNTLATFDKRMPPPLSRRYGLPASKAEQAAFAESLRVRVTTEAFALAAGVALPRSRADFQKLLTLGMPRLVPTFETALKLLGNLRAELEQTTRALDAAQSQPGAAQASADIREQLDLLLPADLLHHTPLSQLAHLPRYLSAARARLTRAIHDPRKDAAKAEPIAPLVRAFAAKYPKATDRAAAQHLLFRLEELRVATFAPELRPQKPPSIAEATREVAELG
ncbi:MAG TPA: ATP-dependent RNA helicase HrpA [Polyangiaceae bacterium]|nr:ATP-dependent RNA helicase HrpA [Polyangiaceae bacterium]